MAGRMIVLDNELGTIMWRVVIVMCTLVLDVSFQAGVTSRVVYHKGYPCNQSILVPALAAGYIDFPSDDMTSPTSSVTLNSSDMASEINTSSRQPQYYYCHLLIGTWDTGYRIRVTFNGTLRSDVTSSCDKEYVHVGNSRYAVDIKSMTSYKFCGTGSDVTTTSPPLQEVVSRGRKLWVVYYSAIEVTESAFSGVRLKYESLPTVACKNRENNTYFRCSPVECIPYEQVCDGWVHCSNGRDEYCDRVNTYNGDYKPVTMKPLHTGPSQPLPALWYVAASLGDEITCFICEDGTCIRPTLPIYHVNRGEAWWWLCDNVPHCRDRTDERMDVCLTMQSKSSALYNCPSGGRRRHPTSSLSSPLSSRRSSLEWLSLGRNVSGVLWRRLTCDDVVHCHDGEDEDILLCTPTVDNSKRLRDKILIPVAALVVFAFTLACVYNRDKCIRSHYRSSRSSRNSTVVRSEASVVIVEQQTPDGKIGRDKCQSDRNRKETVHTSSPIEEDLVEGKPQCGQSPPLVVVQGSDNGAHARPANYYILSQTSV